MLLIVGTVLGVAGQAVPLIGGITAFLGLVGSIVGLFWPDSEPSADDIWNLFSQAYLDGSSTIGYREHHLYEHGSAQGIRLTVDIDGTPHILTGEGNGPINAAMHALESAGIKVQVRSYEERSMVPIGEDGNAQACAFMEVAGDDGGDHYGVGIDSNIVTASLKALISGINRVASQRAVEFCRKAA